MRLGSSMGPGGTGDLGTTLIIRDDRLSVRTRGDCHSRTPAHAGLTEKIGGGLLALPLRISVHWHPVWSKLPCIPTNRDAHAGHQS